MNIMTTMYANSSNRNNICGTNSRIILIDFRKCLKHIAGISTSVRTIKYLTKLQKHEYRCPFYQTPEYGTCIIHKSLHLLEHPVQAAVFREMVRATLYNEMLLCTAMHNVSSLMIQYTELPVSLLMHHGPGSHYLIFNFTDI